MNKSQKRIREVFKNNNFQYFSPLSQFTRLVEETGELARILNHLYGDKPKKQSEAKQDLEDELGDVYFTLVCLANSTGVDLDKGLEKSVSKLITRDKNRYDK
jgi:NTP pyrophosphatase (non-canonical NTP hydrolase)